MDKLIIELYKKNILQIKNIKLKNGAIVPFYIDLYKICDNKYILNGIIDELNNLINEQNIYTDYIFGIKDICKNISTILAYKYNYNNIIESNLRNIKLDVSVDNNNDNNNNNNNNNNNLRSCLLLKCNYGVSSKTNTIITNMLKYNIDVKYIISLINFNTNTNTIDSTSKKYYLFDYYQILNILYSNKYLDYEKYINMYGLLCDNSYLNLEERLKKNINIYTTNIVGEIIKKKSGIIFCCSLIQKLEFKDLIKTLDFIGKHVSIVKIDNFKKYSDIEKKSLIKIAGHYNFKILSEDIFNTNTFIKLVNIEILLNNTYKFENVETIIYDNVYIDDFSVIRNKIYRKIKNIDSVMGIITNNNIFLQENKLKIFEIKKLEDKMLEDKIIRYDYDLLIVNTVDTLVSIKQLAWNLYEKKNKTY